MIRAVRNISDIFIEVRLIRGFDVPSRLREVSGFTRGEDARREATCDVDLAVRCSGSVTRKTARKRLARIID
jgi:hypothetical protein